MDQKRAMLYPPIDQDQNTAQRISASASIGLPTEAPPSYDMAIGAGPSSTSAAGGWTASVPVAPPEIIVKQPQVPMPMPTPKPPPGNVMVGLQSHQQLPAEVDITSALPTKLGPNPCLMSCPSCGARKTTRVTYTPNLRTHLCALVLCLVGWCCCACCVPYCVNSCRTGNHYCSKCNAFLGTYDPNLGK